MLGHQIRDMKFSDVEIFTHGRISKKIDDMIEWLEELGVRVHRYVPELQAIEARGMYRSTTKEIFLHCNEAHVALMTLAHEAGHWASYERHPDPDVMTRLRGEREAMVLGWRILLAFNCLDIISREEWCRFHRESWKQSTTFKDHEGMRIESR